MARKSKNNFHGKVKKYQLNNTEKVLLFIIGLFGFILFWRGLAIVMGSIPMLNNPLFLVVLGFVIMYTSGLLIKLGK
ncbi:MAG TPA: hypothetical protein HA230_04710 [Candidatus Aenigmarchaeota archaeon]|nr:hypothetical protein [Candidatus Aenigmarchaeota archaeon]